MLPYHNTLHTPRPVRAVALLVGLLRAHWFWLGLLAAQFLVFQLVLQVQYHDSNRNLHWGRYTVENPAFMTGARDSYATTHRIDPLPPDSSPAHYAQKELDTIKPSFHAWWGPVPVLLWAGTWWLTGSQLAMTLVVPLMGAGLVLVVYGMGRDLYDAQVGLAAAALLALLPVFREHVIISYSESISTLFLTLAIWAYLRERTLLAVGLGVLAVLCKLDMPPVYLSLVGMSLLWRLWQRAPARRLLHPLAALVVPLLAVFGWFWVRTGGLLPPQGVDSHLSSHMLLTYGLSFIERFFYIDWFIALPIIAGMLLLAGWSLRQRPLPGETALLLATWAGLGMALLLLYMSIDLASNSPRIIIPELPPLLLLVAAGWLRLPRRPRLYLAVGLLAILLSGNIRLTLYQLHWREALQSRTAVWETLDEQPRGPVLGDLYWATMWHTHQPQVRFQPYQLHHRIVLHDRANFKHFISEHAVRYVYLARSNLRPPSAAPPLEERQFGPEVVAYLEEHASERIEAGDFLLYVLPQPPDNAAGSAP
jgi:hypothetical protein